MSWSAGSFVMSTLEQIRDFLERRVDSPPGELTPETRLDQIGVDSFALLDLMFELEETFGIRLPNDLPRPETVGQVIELFERLKPATVDE
jgi:acyl carrier protein